MKRSELAMRYFPMKSEAETHSGLPFCMISYSYGIRTVIIVVQEQLFL